MEFCRTTLIPPRVQGIDRVMVIGIGLPDAAELERMSKVRLKGELERDDLSAIAELALGMVGADAGRAVKDPRRAVR
jgi:hypothetical protein